MKMTIREVIEQLEATARGLPLGMDSPVIVMLCDGEAADGSRELQIDTLTWVSKTGTDTDYAAMIQGHPHIDRDEGQQTHFPGVADEADEALRGWTGEDKA